MGGIMSDNCDSNPDFCHFNRVHMVYCDGNSFSGNADEPVTVKGKKLYFRGKRIIDAVLQTLTSGQDQSGQDYGLADAENVLLTGCSAGGLATYLHTDYVRDQLTTMAPNMSKFKASAISGFFLLHNNTEGKPVYPDEMKRIFQLANSTDGLNDACISNQTKENRWKCNFAQMAYNYTSSPTFPLNSALDSWQTSCILTSEMVPGFPNQTDTVNGLCAAAEGWSACAGDPEKCNPKQMGVMNTYISNFTAIMGNSSTFTKQGNGAFVHSCHTHCEAQTDAWNKFQISGTSMQQAVHDWWVSDGTDSADKHTFQPCQYQTTSPHKCNPTC